MNPHKDYENTQAGTMAQNFTNNSPDIENGGQVPNVSINWDAQAFDRMEGNIKGKNKTLNRGSYMGNQTEYIDPTKR